MYILGIVVYEIMLNVCMWMVSEILRENWIFSRFPTYQKLKASGDNWKVIKEPKLPQMVSPWISFLPWILSELILKYLVIIHT